MPLEIVAKAYLCEECGIEYTLQAEAENCEKSHIWPKVKDIEIWSSKESAYESVRDLGYPSGSDAERHAEGVAYMIALEVEFFENGDYRIIKVEKQSVNLSCNRRGE